MNRVPTHQQSRATTDEQAHARLSHRLLTAQVVGKGSLGLGFIVSIFGLTDHSSWTLRTGLALLLLGMIASVVGLVHSFTRHRLSKASPSTPDNRSRPGPPQPPKDGQH